MAWPSLFSGGRGGACPRPATLVACICAAFLISCQQKAELPATSQPEREAVEAKASVDKAVATTGDLLTYSVTVDHEAGVEVEIPQIAANIAGFRIVDLGRDEPVSQGDRVIERSWFELRADLVGSYVLPPIEVLWRPAGDPEAASESIATSELFVEVASVLPEGEEVTDIRSLKDLRPPAQAKIWPWAAGGGAVLAVALIAYLLWRRRQARRFVPPRPAHEIAFEALDRLRSTDFEDPEAVRRYYFALSEIVRAYVEGRWKLNATDLTTEEIFDALVERRPMLEVHEEKLRRFLLDTDRVKFAAYEASSEEIRSAYEDALSFVESTRASLTQEKEEAEDSEMESPDEEVAA